MYRELFALDARPAGRSFRTLIYRWAGEDRKGYTTVLVIDFKAFK